MKCKYCIKNTPPCHMLGQTIQSDVPTGSYLLINSHTDTEWQLKCYSASGCLQSWICKLTGAIDCHLGATYVIFS